MKDESISARFDKTSRKKDISYLVQNVPNGAQFKYCFFRGHAN